jgi:hypothetical protein
MNTRPLEGSASSAGALFSPPKFAFDLERLLVLMNTTGWASIPSGYIATYDFVLNEVGEILNLHQTQGPQISGIEEVLARISVVSPALIGVDPIPASCQIELFPFRGR